MWFAETFTFINSHIRLTRAVRCSSSPLEWCVLSNGWYSKILVISRDKWVCTGECHCAWRTAWGGSLCNDILITAATVFLLHTRLFSTAQLLFLLQLRLGSHYPILGNCRSLGCITSVLSVSLSFSEKAFNNIFVICIVFVWWRACSPHTQKPMRSSHDCQPSAEWTAPLQHPAGFGQLKSTCLQGGMAEAHSAGGQWVEQWLLTLLQMSGDYKRATAAQRGDICLLFL